MKTYGCNNVYNSLSELVKDKNVDAVGVYTDGPLHVDHAVEAMEHGKHVISAVPACWATVEQGERLLDAVKRTGQTYMMAETSYFQQKTISARKFYEAGKFGRFITASPNTSIPVSKCCISTKANARGVTVSRRCTIRRTAPPICSASRASD